MVQEERARKAAVRKSRMESDLDAESADLQEKKGVRCEHYVLILATLISELSYYVEISPSVQNSVSKVSFLLDAFTYIHMLRSELSSSNFSI